MWREKKKPAAAYFPALWAVSSALEGLTSVFGMGTGMAPPPWPPAVIVHVPCGGGRIRPARGCIPDTGGAGRRPAWGAGGMAKPHGLLVPLGCARRRACTCGLSTRWCAGGLQGGPCPLGIPVSGRASRLDAFSGYHSRTWLPGACSWRNNRHARGASASVLSY